MTETPKTPEHGPHPADSTPIPRPKRKRTSRKRVIFRKTPKPAWPVRGLWEEAPQDMKQKAHATCVAILSFWMGKKTKQEVAEELGITPLRVWQLSQSALSGMLAGLLPQPRRKVPQEVFEKPPLGSRTSLEKRVRTLEAELSRTEDLVRVLRMAPWQADGTESTSKGVQSRARKKPKSKRKRPPQPAALDRPSPHRSGAPSDGRGGQGPGGSG